MKKINTKQQSLESRLSTLESRVTALESRETKRRIAREVIRKIGGWFVKIPLVVASFVIIAQISNWLYDLSNPPQSDEYTQIKRELTAIKKQLVDTY